MKINHIVQTCTLLAVTIFTSSAWSQGGPTPPGFTKNFLPDTIGPGSVSVLEFTIDNSSESVPVGDLAFSDTLPAGMDLAAPAFISNSCLGTLTAPDGGSTITVSDGMVGANKVCTVRVNVTATATGSYENTSGALTSNAGNSGTASATLDVDDNLPGFSKSFAPASVAFGGRSTLTLTIDNTTDCGECASDIVSLNFTDNLPPGMVVANPANASTDCEDPVLPATLTANPGASLVSLSVFGTAGFPALGAEEICTVTVDVIGGAVGSLGNVTSELLFDNSVSAGKAAAVLSVTGASTVLELTKDFTSDPVAPGGSTTLEFTIFNRSRDDSATGITFSDDLDSTLIGLTATLPPIPDPACGAGSNLEFNLGVLTLTGGSLPAESSCSFRVELNVPNGSTPGTYPNITTAISGDVGGAAVIGNMASDTLFVVSFPVLTKEFTSDPVGSGGSVTLEFTITNPEAGSVMSSIAFVDELTAGAGDGGVPTGFLPFPVSVTLPPIPDPPCGAGSSLALEFFDTDRQRLSLIDGSLAAAGMAGDSCTFEVTVDIPAGFPGGTYNNTTGQITGVLDDFAGTPTVVGPGASDNVIVVAAPQLSKEFTDDPVLPGGTVSLAFTLENADDLNSATAIAFSDDLGATLAGLIHTSTLTNTCGGAVSGTGTDLFGYSGGSLAPEASCSIILSLSVPGTTAGGSFPNTSSNLTATVAGLAASSAAASDNLMVSGLVFSKEFTDDPVIAGDTVTLSFTLDNTGGTADATSIAFTDSLDDTLGGLVATGLPIAACGGNMATFDGGQTVNFTGGSVLMGDSCNFSISATVPAVAEDGSYNNVTSANSAIIDASFVVLFPATDTLVVDSTLLQMSKEFTDDPVPPGGTVTLEFNLTNLSASDTVTDIAFDDDLDATLSGLQTTGAVVNTCGGMATSLFPTGLFSYSGGSLAPGASCTIGLTVNVPAGPLAGNLFPNTTTGVSGKVGALDVFGAAASDSLQVEFITFGKSFDGPTTATGTAELTFTINNLDSGNAVGELSFSDDLGAVIPGLAAVGLPMSNVCGAGSVLSGTSLITLSNGNLPAGGVCSFSVTVAVPVSATGGSFVNSTSQLFLSSRPTANPATDTLIVEPAPLFSKIFMPSTIESNTTSVLRFAIDNTASTLAASNLDFTDNLPAGVTVATPANASTTCSGGVVTAGAGTGVITYTGGTLAGGSSCMLEVDVTSALPGGYINTTGDLTSSSGNSGTASATLTVDPIPVVRSFTGPLPSGGTGTLSFTTADPACTFAADPEFLDEATVNPPPPAGLSLFDGVLGFVIVGCTPGATVDISMDYGRPVDPAARYWKAGSPWFTLPSSIVGNIITFSITDGGSGDTDGSANGTIVDPGGAALSTPLAGPPAPIPTVGPLGLWALAFVMMCLGLLAFLRREYEFGRR